MKKFFVALLMLVSLAVPGLVATSPAYACKDTMFAIPARYRGLQDSNCNIAQPDANSPEKFVMQIGLNVVQALMVIIAYIAVFFIIKGGFGYMTSAGSPEGMASARKTITNAGIGLVISALAASIVNAIAGAIK